MTRAQGRGRRMCAALAKGENVPEKIQQDNRTTSQQREQGDNDVSGVRGEATVCKPCRHIVRI